MQVAIMDYGMGNLGSLQAMADRLDLDSVLWRQGALPRGSDFVIFPGVGSLENAMRELSKRELLTPLDAARRQAVPILGICLGMQLLFGEGDEGGHGLGWLSGTIPRLSAKRTPHMGWNTVHPVRPTPLLPSSSEDSQAAYYFVHSYAVRPHDQEVALGETLYEGETFVSVVQAGSLVGVQFHPELSGPAGRGFLQSFLTAVVS